MQITTCLAVNTVAFMEELPAYLQNVAGVRTAYVSDDDASWAERLVHVADGVIELGWICGLHYVRLADGQKSDLELLAAPVYAAPRYARRAVYFSDVVVRRDAAYDSPEALRGAIWAYNEPGSLSGRLSMRHFLATQMAVAQGKAEAYFGKVVESGAHAASLALLLDGQSDCAAIDSTLLDYLLQAKPALAEEIRVLHELGSFPVPPLVIHRCVPAELRQRIRSALLEMHHRAEGQELLAQGALAHFVAVEDADYNPVRHMMAAVEDS